MSQRSVAWYTPRALLSIVFIAALSSVHSISRCTPSQAENNGLYQCLDGCDGANHYLEYYDAYYCMTYLPDEGSCFMHPFDRKDYLTCSVTGEVPSKDYLWFVFIGGSNQFFMLKALIDELLQQDPDSEPPYDPYNYWNGTYGMSNRQELQMVDFIWYPSADRSDFINVHRRAREFDFYGSDGFYSVPLDLADDMLHVPDLVPGAVRISYVNLHLAEDFADRFAIAVSPNSTWVPGVAAATAEEEDIGCKMHVYMEWSALWGDWYVETPLFEELINQLDARSAAEGLGVQSFLVTDSGNYCSTSRNQHAYKVTDAMENTNPSFPTFYFSKVEMIGEQQELSGMCLTNGHAYHPMSHSYLQRYFSIVCSPQDPREDASSSGSAPACVDFGIYSDQCFNEDRNDWLSNFVQICPIYYDIVSYASYTEMEYCPFDESYESELPQCPDVESVAAAAANNSSEGTNSAAFDRFVYTATALALLYLIVSVLADITAPTKADLAAAAAATTAAGVATKSNSFVTPSAVIATTTSTATAATTRTVIAIKTSSPQNSTDDEHSNGRQAALRSSSKEFPLLVHSVSCSEIDGPAIDITTAVATDADNRMSEKQQQQQQLEKSESTEAFQGATTAAVDAETSANTTNNAASSKVSSIAAVVLLLLNNWTADMRLRAARFCRYHTNCCRNFYCFTASNNNNNSKNNNNNSSSGRFEALGFARYLASVHIVLGHMYQGGHLGSFRSFNIFGYTWVPWFFMLSGFILTVAERKRNVQNAKKRAATAIASVAITNITAAATSTADTTTGTADTAASIGVATHAGTIPLSSIATTAAAAAREITVASIAAYVARRMETLFPGYLIGIFANIGTVWGLLGRMNIPAASDVLIYFCLMQSWVPSLLEDGLGYLVQCWFMSCLLFYWIIFQYIFRFIETLSEQQQLLLLFTVSVLLPLFYHVIALSVDAEWYSEHSYGSTTKGVDVATVTLKFHPLAYLHIFVLGCCLPRARDCLLRCYSSSSSSVDTTNNAGKVRSTATTAATAGTDHQAVASSNASDDNNNSSSSSNFMKENNFVAHVSNLDDSEAFPQSTGAFAVPASEHQQQQEQQQQQQQQQQHQYFTAVKAARPLAARTAVAWSAAALRLLLPFTSLISYSCLLSVLLAGGDDIPGYKLSLRLGLISILQALLLLGLSFQCDILAAVFSHPLLQQFGKYSFPQYIFQFMAYAWFRDGSGEENVDLRYFLLLFATSVGVSIIVDYITKKKLMIPMLQLAVPALVMYLMLQPFISTYDISSSSSSSSSSGVVSNRRLGSFPRYYLSDQRMSVNIDSGLVSGVAVFNPTIFIDQPETPFRRFFVARLNHISSDTYAWRSDEFLLQRWHIDLVLGSFDIRSHSSSSSGGGGSVLQQEGVAISFGGDFLPCAPPLTCNANGTVVAKVTSGPEDPRIFQWRGELFVSFFSYDNAHFSVSGAGNATADTAVAATITSATAVAAAAAAVAPAVGGRGYRGPYGIGTEFCVPDSNGLIGRMYIARLFETPQVTACSLGPLLPVRQSSLRFERYSIIKNWLAFTYNPSSDSSSDSSNEELFFIHQISPEFVIMRVVAYSNVTGFDTQLQYNSTTPLRIQQLDTRAARKGAIRNRALVSSRSSSSSSKSSSSGGSSNSSSSSSSSSSDDRLAAAGRAATVWYLSADSAELLQEMERQSNGHAEVVAVATTAAIDDVTATAATASIDSTSKAATLTTSRRQLSAATITAAAATTAATEAVLINDTASFIHGSANPVLITAAQSGWASYYLSVFHTVSRDADRNYASYAFAFCSTPPFRIIALSPRLQLTTSPTTTTTAAAAGCAEPFAFVTGLSLVRCVDAAGGGSSDAGDFCLLISYGVCDLHAQVAVVALEEFENSFEWFDDVDC